MARANTQDAVRFTSFTFPKHHALVASAIPNPIPIGCILSPFVATTNTHVS